MQRRRKTTQEERVCSICSQRFKKIEHLDRHLRSHTQEKPFACGLCGKAFSRRDTLSRHSRSHKQCGSRGLPYSRGSHNDGPAETSVSVRNTFGNSVLATADDINAAASFQDTSGELRDHRGDPLHGCRDNNAPLPEGRDNGVDLGWCQYDPTTQWEPEISSDFHWGNQIGLDWLGLLSNIELPPSDPYPSDFESNSNSRGDIQRRWHTFLHETPAKFIRPDRKPEHFEIDQTCYQSLANRLRQRVHNGPVPSTAFFNLAMSAYFRNFQCILPIVHIPSFRVHSRNAPLLLSICSIGSLFLGSSQALSYGIDLYERLNKANLSSWELLLSSSSERYAGFVTLQSAILGQMFGFLMGRPKDLLQLDLFHGTIISLSRQLNVFKTGFFEKDIHHLEGQDLEEAWNSWAQLEERKRMIIAIRLQDIEISCLFHHDPLLRHSVKDLPRASSMEAFSAPNAESWKRIMVKEALKSRSIPVVIEEPISFPTEINELELLLMLRIIGDSASDKQKLDTTYRKVLIQFYRRYKRERVFQVQESSLMMLWHFIFMSAHMNADILERFCGREGPDIAEKFNERVRAWAESEDAKICLVHALQVQRHFERISVGTEPPFHFPICLYRCGIAFFCYFKFVRTAAAFADGDLDLVELGALKDLRGLPLSSSVISDDGGQVTNPLPSVIHLLQRTSHWRLAHSLASTLLALVEDDWGVSGTDK